MRGPSAVRRGCLRRGPAGIESRGGVRRARGRDRSDALVARRAGPGSASSPPGSRRARELVTLDGVASRVNLMRHANTGKDWPSYPPGGGGSSTCRAELVPRAAHKPREALQQALMCRTILRDLHAHFSGDERRVAHRPRRPSWSRGGEVGEFWQGVVHGHGLSRLGPNYEGEAQPKAFRRGQPSQCCPAMVPSTRPYFHHAATPALLEMRRDGAAREAVDQDQPRVGLRRGAHGGERRHEAALRASRARAHVDAAGAAAVDEVGADDVRCDGGTGSDATALAGGRVPPRDSRTGPTLAPPAGGSCTASPLATALARRLSSDPRRRPVLGDQMRCLRKRA